MVCGEGVGLADDALFDGGGRLERGVTRVKRGRIGARDPTHRQCGEWQLLLQQLQGLGRGVECSASE